MFFQIPVESLAVDEVLESMTVLKEDGQVCGENEVLDVSQHLRQHSNSIAVTKIIN